LWFGHCHPNYDVVVDRVPRYGRSATGPGRQHLEPIKSVTGAISKAHSLMQVDVRIAYRRGATAEKEQRQDRPGDAPHGDRI
jgi:hypothetical protein